MKKVKADIVVVSAGTAGLSAAVAAAEGGAKVIAFEKAGHTGGTALRANQVCAVESRLQRLKGYSLTREEAFKIFMDFTQWSVNARLVKIFLDRSAETIDWLEGMGVEFCDLACHGAGMNYTAHFVKERTRRPGLGAAATLMDILAERAKEIGVQIFLKTPAQKLIKKNGRIVGVVAKDASGEEIQAEAGAVILATGGFGAYFRAPFGIPGLEGDGIRMAREAGAETTNGTMTSPPRMGSHKTAASGMAVMAAFSQPNLTVNLLGERFVDELTMVKNPLASNALTRQKGQTAFTIFDEDTKKIYVEKGFEFIGSYGIAQFGEPATKATNFDAELKELMKHNPGDIVVADTIEELAAGIGVNAAALKETVKEYNKACETGRDEAFNTPARYLRPVKKPRFYARRRMSFRSGSLEGIRINHRTEVLTKDYEVVPGLYAVGMEAACNIYRDIYPNVLPGNAMGWSLGSGRMAAENALKYIKSIRS
jgi:fumarate reductase flavoprotein subunit